MTKQIFEAGQVYEFVYPFIREEVDLWDEDGRGKTLSWRPGVRYTYPDDSKAVADGLGKQVVTVISTHKPGRYPERVFYLRQWQSPSGKAFGKTKLMTKITPAFRRLVAGYPYPYEIVRAA
jgi:hypothetical protein